MNIITLDFETYWSSKDYTLSKTGPIQYIRDKRFSTQLLGVRVNQSAVQVYEHDDIPEVLRSLELHKQDRLVVGHNINGFDALILSEIYDVHPYWIFDTMVAARWTGISRVCAESHGALTAYLGTGVKTAGTVISDGKHWPYDFTPMERQAFKQYCADDVLQCSKNMYKMLPYCTPECVKFGNMTAKMATDPIFKLDLGLLADYIKELDDRAEQARLDLSRIFHFKTKEDFLSAVRSSDKFCAMLRYLGVEPPMKFSATKTATKKMQLEAECAATNDNVRKHEIVIILSDVDNYAVYTPALAKTDLELLDLRDHPDPRVGACIDARLLNNSSIQRSRAQTFYNLSLDGKPLPVMLNAYKAHTSRYTAGNSEGASDATQLQNLNKRDPNQLTLRKAIQAPPGYKVVAADSSQIEARLLAYAANEMWLLDAFRKGEDPYSQQASMIYGGDWQTIRDGAKRGDREFKTQRHVAKTCVLSGGYGVGRQKFSNTLLRAGAKLHEDLEQHHQLAFNAHAIYRQSNPNIVALWGVGQNVIVHLEQGGSGFFGGPNDNLFEYGWMPILDGPAVPSIKLPSGFILRYPNLCCEQGEKRKVEYYYTVQRGRSAVKTKIYGGKLIENLIQSVAFQLLQYQATTAMESGVPIKANNHDAWISVVPEPDADKTYHLLTDAMQMLPSWLPDFPVGCEGDIGDDYTIA